MNHRVLTSWLAVIAMFLSALSPFIFAQGRAGGGEAQAAVSPQQSAPIDLTGYWVSLVTDNWTYRVVTPPKGDYLYLPPKREGRPVAAPWIPRKTKLPANNAKVMVRSVS